MGRPYHAGVHATTLSKFKLRHPECRILCLKPALDLNGDVKARAAKLSAAQLALSLGAAFKRVFWNRKGWPIIEVLLLIALASTVAAVALQRHFGRFMILILLGQTLAAVGAAVFALWLRRGK